MKILVTGATGTVGSEVVKALHIRFGLLRDAERSGRRNNMVETPW